MMVLLVVVSFRKPKKREAWVVMALGPVFESNVNLKVIAIFITFNIEVIIEPPPRTLD
jgi:hypothetical protein